MKHKKAPEPSKEGGRNGMTDGWRDAFARRESGAMDDAEARRLSAIFWNSYMPSMGIVVESAERKLERAERRTVEHTNGPVSALKRMLGLTYRDEQAKNDAIRKAKAELIATYEQSDSYIHDYMRLSGNLCAIYTPRRTDLLEAYAKGTKELGTAESPTDVFDE